MVDSIFVLFQAVEAVTRQECDCNDETCTELTLEVVGLLSPEYLTKEVVPKKAGLKKTEVVAAVSKVVEKHRGFGDLG